LKVKKDVKILIFDRYGRKVYSNEKQSTYIWDGTSNGRVLPTGTYWYILEWTEPDNGAKLSFKDWILIKERK
jgi:gliding motility-associated-like protein